MNVFYQGIVLAIRHCMMQKTLSISVKEFALLITRIKQQSSSLVELVLDVFGGKLHPDGRFCVILCC